MDWRDRVLKLMKERDFKTRNDLCIKAGISAGSLNMAINGTHELKLSTMGKLAEALNTTTQWLLYGDDMVEASLVPLIPKKYTASFILTGQVPENCLYVQVGSSLKVSDSAYAWKNFQDDMFPNFIKGDILIIDSCDLDNFQENKSLSVLTANGYCDRYTDNLTDCLKEGKYVRFYISNLVNLSSEFYFESLHSSRPPKLFTFPTKQSSGMFDIPVGVVVQLIRTFVQD